MLASTAATASSAQKASDCQSNGAGMRKSPQANEPNRCTSPMPMCRKKATITAGTTAADGQTSSASMVTSAAGIRMSSRGRIKTFTGRAKTVMRWK